MRERNIYKRAKSQRNWSGSWNKVIYHTWWGHKLSDDSINVLWHFTSSFLDDPFMLSWDDLWPSPIEGGHDICILTFFLNITFLLWKHVRDTASWWVFRLYRLYFGAISGVNSFPFLSLLMLSFQSYHFLKRKENHIRNDILLRSWRETMAVVYAPEASAVSEEISLNYVRSTSFADVMWWKCPRCGKRRP